MLRYIDSTQGFNKNPFQEDKLRRLNGISDDQVREILDKSQRKATATPRAATANPPSTATGPSLAAAQPTRGHATGKAIAMSATSHLAAE